MLLRCVMPDAGQHLGQQTTCLALPIAPTRLVEGLTGRISPRTHGRGEREGAGAGVAVALAYTMGPMAAESASWGNGSPV
jgi:hypothetical protein